MTELMTYRKKPIVIEAFCLGVDEVPDWAWRRRNDDIIFVFGENPQLIIETLEGTMIAESGDYIIKGVKGEIYPCKPDIFIATYEALKHE